MFSDHREVKKHLHEEIRQTRLAVQPRKFYKSSWANLEDTKKKKLQKEPENNKSEKKACSSKKQTSGMAGGAGQRQAARTRHALGEGCD
jgi:hypothetical protein